MIEFSIEPATEPSTASQKPQTMNNTTIMNESTVSPFKAKDPITCHVLDQTTGRPAPSINASLTLIRPLGPSAPFTALTNNDGRIVNWNQPDGPSLNEIFENLREHADGRMVWELKFDSGAYFGEGRTFFPEVVVKFFVENSIHYHVPLLLGPYSYTTYRGS